MRISKNISFIGVFLFYALKFSTLIENYIQCIIMSYERIEYLSYFIIRFENANDMIQPTVVSNKNESFVKNSSQILTYTILNEYKSENGTKNVKDAHERCKKQQQMM